MAVQNTITSISNHKQLNNRTYITHILYTHTTTERRCNTGHSEMLPFTVLSELPMWSVKMAFSTSFRESVWNVRSTYWVCLKHKWKAVSYIYIVSSKCTGEKKKKNLKQWHSLLCMYPDIEIIRSKQHLWVNVTQRYTSKKNNIRVIWFVSDMCSPGCVPNHSYLGSFISQKCRAEQEVPDWRGFVWIMINTQQVTATSRTE